jgi:outer membrane protein assembly factor BamE
MLLMRRLCLILLPLLAACSSVSETKITDYITPYRIDVRQGNFVSQEMVAQLKPGQTREQVRFILGTPLVSDIFHADRWDYLYRLAPGHGEVQSRRLTVFFVDGKLARVSGDVIPATATTTAPVTPVAREIDLGAAPADGQAKPAAN